jgi:DNA repair protein RadA/Sms
VAPAKRPTGYVCGECGYRAVRRMGRCPVCDAWNTMAPAEPEFAEAGGDVAAAFAGAVPAGGVLLSDAETDSEARIAIGVSEVDRVLGGGLVPGGVVLIGGDPGIGKSTLLLQTLDRLARTLPRVAYVSAEESLRQLKQRAARLGVLSEGILVITEPDLPSALLCAREAGAGCVGIDSIQAVSCGRLDAGPGSIQQVRECTQLAVRFAKTEDVPVIITGHVTKEGGLAGPKSLEHLVDTVLYFEGGQGHAYRVVRAVKNRFGSTDEVGIFEMRDRGLCEVQNPSAWCLSEREEPLAGCAVVGGVQGTRPLLVEVQALVAQSQYGSPRRVASGVDSSRLALLLAVLERRAGVPVSAQDVFVSAAGGMRLAEPAADLGVALAVASAAMGCAGRGRWCMVGEVALTGEVRAVGHLRQRVAEAARMGFERALVPAQNLAASGLSEDLCIEVVPVEVVQDAVALYLNTGRRPRVERSYAEAP